MWNFDESKVKEFDGFKPVPAGDHRVRIAEIAQTKSKSGNDMLKITLDVSGNSSKLFYYLVFMPDKAEITNTNLSNIYKSFNLPAGDMNFQSWVGKVGACKVKLETYNGQENGKVAYFIALENQDKLPAWVEGYAKVDDDLPF